MKLKLKTWPKEGDKYFFVADDLCVGYDKFTEDAFTDDFDRQTARRMAGNFFQTWEGAKEMADKAYELFNF